jgi:predicted dehydrogenase
MECVSLGRKPLAGANVAYETMKITYAGYWSAEEGRRIAVA